MKQKKTPPFHRLVLAILASGTTSALANQPPGPMVLLPEVVILPIMVLLSVLGGYYDMRAARETVAQQAQDSTGQPKRGFDFGRVVLALLGCFFILFFAEAAPGLIVFFLLVYGVNYAITKYRKRKADPRETAQTKSQPKRTGLKVAGVICLIVLSGASEGLGFFVALAFSLIAVSRGGQMLWWGWQARRPAVVPGEIHLPPIISAPTPQPARLMIAGAVLVPAAIFFGGMAAAFVNYWPREQSIEDGFCRLVALQMAYDQHQPEPTAQKVARQLPRQVLEAIRSDDRYFFQHVVWEAKASKRGFIAYLPPVNRLPFFPYNYLTSLPSLRADETGEIRMVRVHHKGRRCPADAPVVRRISPEELKAAKETVTETLGAPSAPAKPSP